MKLSFPHIGFGCLLLTNLDNLCVFLEKDHSVRVNFVRLQAVKSEEEFLLHATSKIAHLCAYNVVLWQQFVEMCTYNLRIMKLMAKEYHQSRVGFAFSCELGTTLPSTAFVVCGYWLGVIS